MRKYVYILLALLLALGICACGKAEAEPQLKKWDCSVKAAETSGEGHYVITYCPENIVSSTGTFTIQNRNGFDIVVHLLTEGEEERTSSVKAGGAVSLHQIKKDADYQLGVHARVEEGTAVNVAAYDGQWAETYVS